MNPSSETIYASGEYLRNNPGWHEEDAPWKTRQILTALHRHGVQPRSICDVGCGAGEIIRELAQAFPQAQCVGFDVSPDALAVADSKAGGNLRFSLGSPLGGAEHFDLACAIDVFEHVEDYLGFLRGMCALADWKVYHIPLDVSAQTVVRARPLRDVRTRVGHLHFFTKDQALATLEYTGHQVVDWFYTPVSLEAPNRTANERVLALPRRVLFKAAPDFAVRLLGGYSVLALCR